jgi:DNA topoisomerase-1
VRRLPRYEVFKCCDEEGEIKYVKSRELNAYIKEVIGEVFMAKDFRTWAGTLIALKLTELGATEDLKAAEKNVVAE